VTANTLGEVLHDSATRWPDRVAVADAAGDRTLTYRDLDTVITDLSSP
jgi:non-ribosomal peptide synthetase component E (peptide arylation enzyme)